MKVADIQRKLKEKKRITTEEAEVMAAQWDGSSDGVLNTAFIDEENAKAAAGHEEDAKAAVDRW